MKPAKDKDENPARGTLDEFFAAFVDDDEEEVVGGDVVRTVDPLDFFASPTEDTFDDDGVVLTEEQSAAVTAIMAAVDSGAILATLSGRAGTGKTTCGRQLRRELQRRADRTSGWVLFLAPTWRALLQAREKSRVPAATSRTLHAAVYAGPDLSVEEQIEAAEEQVRKDHKLWEKAEAGTWTKLPMTPAAEAQYAKLVAAIHAEFAESEGASGRLRFTKPREWALEDRPAAIVVDEAGMVPEKILRDLRMALGDVPVIGVGDGHQLGPVSGEPAFDLRNPTAELVTPHRQTEGSKIHALATWLADNPTRLGRRHDVWARFGFPVLRASIVDMGRWLAQNAAADNEIMCLVARHAVRRALNDSARIAEGRPHPLYGPQVGERVLFRGHGAGGAVNGEFGTVRAVAPPVPSPITKGEFAGVSTIERRLDVFPAVIEIERLGHRRLVGGGVMRAAWHPPKPKDEGRIPNDLFGTARRLARAQQRAFSLSRGVLEQDYAQARALYARDCDEVAACLGAANAVLSAAPLFAVVDGGFGLPIAPGRASTTWVAQGSDYENVAVILESLPWLEEWEPNYWYTAVTRASKNLYPIVITDRI